MSVIKERNIKCNIKSHIRGYFITNHNLVDLRPLVKPVDYKTIVSHFNRSALVNIRQKALLSLVGFRKRMTLRSPRSFHMWFICSSIFYIWLVWFLVRDFVPLFRSFLDWFQSIQTRRCHCLRLKDVLMFQASSYSAGKRTFQWMLLNNILWMAPDHQAVYLGEIIHYHFPYWIHI